MATACTVAATAFWLAWSNGGYGIVTRTSLAVALWWTIAVGVATGLWPLRRVTRAGIASGTLLLGLGMFALLSAAWAPSVEAAVLEFDRILLYVAIFALACLAGTRSTLPAWCDGLAVAIAAIGCVALASRLFPQEFSDRGAAEFLPGAQGRLSFPLGYWNGLAVLLALGFPLILRMAVQSRSRLAAAGAVASLPALVSVVYLTSSRGGVAAGIVGITVLMLLSDRRWQLFGATVAAAAGSALALAAISTRKTLVDHPDAAGAVTQGRHAAPVVVLGMLAAGTIHFFVLPRLDLRVRAGVARWTVAGLTVAALGLVLLAHPVRRFEIFKRLPSEVPHDSSGGFVQQHLFSAGGSGRWQFWASALDEWRSAPIAGGGAASYESWWNRHGSFAYVLRDAHSLYLETLGELGVIGLALLVSAIAVALLGGISRIRGVDRELRTTVAALVAVVAAWCVAAGVDWMWELTVVTSVAMVALGLLAGAATADDAVAVAVERQTRIRWAAVAGALLLIVPQGVALMTEVRIQASADAAGAGDLERARERATAAESLAPWASTPRIQLALVDEERGKLELARTEVDAAIRRDVGDWRLRLIAARIETKLGNVGRAKARLDEARRMNPLSELLGGVS